MDYPVNPGKTAVKEYEGKEYLRLPIKTPVIKYGDDLASVVRDAVEGTVARGDILFISEKAVACTQKGRAIPLEEIKPRKLAVRLSKYVTKTPAGIGLGMPETMEMALRECGVLRILLAAFVGAVGRLFHRKGWFYRIAGKKAAGIDGPCHYTLPPYNRYVVLAPKAPKKTAQSLSDALGYPLAIIDANDFGIEILGASKGCPDKKRLCAMLRDNVLGQSDEQTPVGILRRL
ncbi:MAG: coenzyme F420-0:L-glutamate ligase [Clostridia bacterium]|nr:coenzyme F420-0:L-glutamate ligase [Clostridia bacterium]